MVVPCFELWQKGPDIYTALVLAIPVVEVVTTDAKEGCMLYNVAFKFMFTTNFNSSLVLCPCNALASRTQT